MLRGMGWQDGTGLGKYGHGITAPVNAMSTVVWARMIVINVFVKGLLTKLQCICTICVVIVLLLWLV